MRITAVKRTAVVKSITVQKSNNDSEEYNKETDSNSEV